MWFYLYTPFFLGGGDLGRFCIKTKILKNLLMAFFYLDKRRWCTEDTQGRVEATKELPPEEDVDSEAPDDGFVRAGSAYGDCVRFLRLRSGNCRNI